MILIYEGAGVSPRSFEGLKVSLAAFWRRMPIRAVSAKELVDGKVLQEAKLLAVPGGADRPYHHSLAGAGNSNIRAFVERGGVYLGICAGAYYGSAFVDFDRGTKDEILEDRELRFFTGSAIGPAFGPGTFDYKSEKGARVVELSSEVLPRGRYRTYFNGGCYFKGHSDGDGVEVLANYTELPGNPPAILFISVQKGHVVLSGVHPEYVSAALDDKDPLLGSIIPKLRDEERSGRSLCADLFSRIAAVI